MVDLFYYLGTILFLINMFSLPSLFNFLLFLWVLYHFICSKLEEKKKLLLICRLGVKEQSYSKLQNDVLGLIPNPVQWIFQNCIFLSVKETATITQSHQPIFSYTFFGKLSCQHVRGIDPHPTPSSSTNPHFLQILAFTRESQSTTSKCHSKL